MADISISLNNVQDIRTVHIEGLGVLKVRKTGSGEDLDLSFKRRRVNKLIDELSAIDFSSLDTKKPSDLKKMERLSQRADAIQDEITEIKKLEFEIYKHLLSDDKGGAIVDVVMNTVSDTGRAEIFRRAFAETKPISTLETVVTDSDGDIENE
jgi:hypothetical protein